MLHPSKLCRRFVVFQAVVIVVLGLGSLVDAADGLDISVAMDNSKPILVNSMISFKVTLRNKSADRVTVFNREDVYLLGMESAEIELTTSDGWRSNDIYAAWGGSVGSFLPVDRFWSALESGDKAVIHIATPLHSLCYMTKGGKSDFIKLGSGATEKCTLRLKVMKRLIAPPLSVKRLGDTDVAIDLFKWSKAHAGYLYESESFPVEVILKAR